MEIKRKIEICVASKRRFVVRQPQAGEQFACAECAAAMLSAEQAAAVCGVSRRRIYRAVEIGAPHYVETDAGVLYVCLNSIGEILEEKL